MGFICVADIHNVFTVLWKHWTGTRSNTNPRICIQSVCPFYSLSNADFPRCPRTQKMNNINALTVFSNSPEYYFHFLPVFSLYYQIVPTIVAELSLWCCGLYLFIHNDLEAFSRHGQTMTKAWSADIHCIYQICQFDYYKNDPLNWRISYWVIHKRVPDCFIFVPQDDLDVKVTWHHRLTCLDAIDSNFL